jgi:hypothetical protein
MRRDSRSRLSTRNFGSSASGLCGSRTNSRQRAAQPLLRAVAAPTELGHTAIHGVARAGRSGKAIDRHALAHERDPSSLLAPAVTLVACLETARAFEWVDGHGVAYYLEDPDSRREAGVIDPSANGRAEGERGPLSSARGLASVATRTRSGRTIVETGGQGPPPRLPVAGRRRHTARRGQPHPAPSAMSTGSIGLGTTPRRSGARATR